MQNNNKIKWSGSPLLLPGAWKRPSDSFSSQAWWEKCTHTFQRWLRCCRKPGTKEHVSWFLFTLPSSSNPGREWEWGNLRTPVIIKLVSFPQVHFKPADDYSGCTNNPKSDMLPTEEDGEKIWSKSLKTQSVLSLISETVIWRGSRRWLTYRVFSSFQPSGT